MFRLSISVAVFVAAIASDLGHAEVPVTSPKNKDRAPVHTILMFGASWCAPCIAELRSIATLAASASPDRIVLAWTDGGVRRYKLALPYNVEIMSGSDAQQMMRQNASSTSGLPYSVMLDEHGRKCAERKAMLRPDAIMQMRAACNRSRSD